MTMQTRLFTAALLTGTALGGAAFSAAHETANPMVGGAEMLDTRTIVENAANSADHTTLVAAVKAADLVDTLSGDGPFTVFAPTDAAFEALPAGIVDTLLMPENKAALQTVLTCHVAAANATAGAIGGMIAEDGGMHVVPSVGGCEIEARMAGDAIILTDERGRKATVTVADVMQSNGVIHVIDSVLLPAEDKIQLAQAGSGGEAMPDGQMSEQAMSDEAMSGDMASQDTMSGDPAADDTMSDDAMAQPQADASNAGSNPMVGGAEMLDTRTIVENAANSADHTTLVAAVKAAGLTETLSGDGPFTVFAPTDAAFDALPDGTVDTLLQEANRDRLTRILTAHVVPGRLTAADLSAGLSDAAFNNFQTASGDALSVQTTPSGAVFVFDERGNAHRVTTADVMQSNGVIHVIDGVLLPR